MNENKLNRLGVLRRKSNQIIYAQSTSHRVYTYISGAFIACTCCTHRRLRKNGWKLLQFDICAIQLNVFAAKFSYSLLLPALSSLSAASLLGLALPFSWFVFFVLLACHVMRPFCGLGANSCCKFGHKNKFYLAICFLFDPGMRLGSGSALPSDEILTKLKRNICKCFTMSR